MELAAALRIRYDLRFCDIAPTDPDSTSSTLGIAQAAAVSTARPQNARWCEGPISTTRLIRPREMVRCESVSRIRNTC